MKDAGERGGGGRLHIPGPQLPAAHPSAGSPRGWAQRRTCSGREVWGCVCTPSIYTTVAQALEESQIRGASSRQHTRR